MVGKEKYLYCKMKKSKIVFLKGGGTTGKSTAFGNLRKLRKEGKMKGWVFINHPELKNWFAYLDDKRQLQKVSLFALVKQVMKTKKNIIIEEMSAKTARKYLKNQIQKYNYELITFEFVMDDLETAYKRDIGRIANKDKHHKKVLGKKKIIQNHERHRQELDKGCIFVNTTKLSKRKVVEFILNNLK
jgi:hypothetical protein